VTGVPPRELSTKTKAHWHVAGVSVRGVSHVKRNQPCQDAHFWREFPGGAMVLSVADGAGSASLSQLGAARAAVSSVDWVAELVNGQFPARDDEWQQLLMAALQTAHESVIAVAEKRKVTARELATTLILSVVTADTVACVQVGDGACVVLTEDGEMVAVTSPQRGEHINETFFFTAPNYQDAAQFAVWHGPVRGVAMFSDGLQMLALKMPEGTPHPAFFIPLFDMVAAQENTREVEEELRLFLQSDRITARADDDLTLVVASIHHL
jgi:hypothetical protein